MIESNRIESNRFCFLYYTRFVADSMKKKKVKNVHYSYILNYFISLPISGYKRNFLFVYNFLISFLYKKKYIYILNYLNICCVLQ